MDAVGAGVGEMVLFASGSSARQTAATDNKPVDAVVMAIVDSWEVDGKEKYRKGETDCMSRPGAGAEHLSDKQVDIIATRLAQRLTPHGREADAPTPPATRSTPAAARLARRSAKGFSPRWTTPLPRPASPFAKWTA